MSDVSSFMIIKEIDYKVVEGRLLDHQYNEELRLHYILYSVDEMNYVVHLPDLTRGRAFQIQLEIESDMDFDTKSIVGLLKTIRDSFNV